MHHSQRFHWSTKGSPQGEPFCKIANDVTFSEECVEEEFNDGQMTKPAV